MKIIVFVAVASLLVSACNTGGQAQGGNTYKAKFEVKALCSNYTFTVIEGNIDTARVVAAYTDESTGKKYRNAFGITNPCDLPSTLKEGDEFYFVIDSAKAKQCITCMAYYPTPSRKLTIKVVDK